MLHVIVSAGRPQFFAILGSKRENDESTTHIDIPTHEKARRLGRRITIIPQHGMQPSNKGLRPSHGEPEYITQK
jgi:hypothetical protein